MLTIVVRVTSVDRFAFTGRDRHPSSADNGQLGVVSGIVDVPCDDGPTSLPLQLVSVTLFDGRTIDLLGHEFALVCAIHDGLETSANLAAFAAGGVR